MDKILPFGINILIKPREDKGVLRTEEGSLCEYGDVLAVGDKVEGIKVGDILAYTKWGCKSVIIEDEKHYFIPLDDRFILGTITMS